jgi:hypothetical protein
LTLPLHFRLPFNRLLAFAAFIGFIFHWLRQVDVRDCILFSRHWILTGRY